METKNAAQVLKEALHGKTHPRIKLLGDSITHGVGGTGWEQCGEVIVEGWAQSPHSYCWAALLRDYMKDIRGATVINKACTGTTVEFVMDHFQTLVDEKDDLIICTIGTNNRHLYFSQGEKPERESFLQELYEKIKRMHAMFCACGIPTILVANIPASQENEQDGVDYWRILHMTDINDLYKRLAQEQGAVVVSLYDLFTAYCEKEKIPVDDLLCDGLHPNDRGYKVMFDLLVKALDV